MRSNQIANPKILIATTNLGKFKEFTHEFRDLPFTFVSLQDVKVSGEPEEIHETTSGNALLKAEWYAKKTKLMTIAEDTGFFIDYLRGEPGVKAKRFGKDSKDCCTKVLERLSGIEKKKRTAYFETAACLYDPSNNSYSMFKGRAEGLISEGMMGEAAPGMLYDPIFYHPASKKHFSEMTITEKNNVSHRGQVIGQLKIFLMRHYGFKQIVVPVALIFDKGKLLLMKRRDSRPEFNNKWEFPGGGVEKGETIEESLLRECKEETGLTVKIEERLPKIATKLEPRWNYQVFLVVFICTVKSGTFIMRDNENSGHGWFSLADAQKQDLLPLNTKVIQENLAILKKYT